MASATIGDRPPSRPDVARGRSSRRSRVLVAALPFVIGVVVFGAVLQHRGSAVTADEPHYLIYSWSLLHDHDVDLRNNYADASLVQRLYGHPEIDPHAYDYRRDGRLVSDHQIGLPLLITPGVAAGGRRGAEIELVVLGALLADQLFRLLAERRIGHGWMVWAVWAGLIGSLPLVAVAGRLFPDVPAALLVVVAVRLLLRNRGRRDLVVASLAVAALPWLHVRYAVLALGLGVALVFRMVRANTAASAAPRQGRGPEAFPMVAPVLSVALLMFAFSRWYGSVLPRAPYHFPGVVNEARPAADVSTLYRYGFGQLLSPAFGWFPAAPLHALGLAAVGLAARRYRAATVWLLGVAVVFLVVAGTLDPGQNLQARFLVAIIPLVALPLLVALATDEWWVLGLMALLGAVTLAIGAEAAVHPTYLNASPNGDVAMPVEHQMAGLFPNMSVGPKDTHAAFQAIDLPRQVGRVVTDPAAVSAGAAGTPRSGDQVVEAGPGDGSGYLAFGSPAAVVAGSYVASFQLRAVHVAAGETAGTLEVASGATVRASHHLDPSEFDVSAPSSGSPPYVTIEVPVRFAAPAKVEWRVRTGGQATLRLAAVSIRSADPGLAHAFRTRFPDIGKVVMWIVVGLAVAVTLALARFSAGDTG